MISKNFSPLLLATFLVCASPLQAADLGRVNGRPIPEAHFKAILDHQIGQGQRDTPEVRAAIREELIRRALLEQAAQTAGLDKDPATQTEIELARQSILVRRYLTHYLQNNPITEKEIQQAYDRFKTLFTGNEYRVRHILFDQETAALEASQQLKSGKISWEELAKQSKDPGSRDKGGDLGWVTPTLFVPQFAEALQRLKKGEITEKPVKTQFGWHLIYLEDLRPQTPPPFAEIRPRLEEQLRHEKIEEHIKALRKEAKIDAPR